MCFDMTYQTKSLNQLMVGGKRVLVGGVWLPDQPTNAMAPLGDDNLCVKSIKRATQMCEFLLWDPSMAKKVPLSACELPMEMNWSGIQARLFASLYVLEAVGTVLLASEDRVQALTLDAATSHHLVRKWLLGQPSDATKESLGDEIPFFSELKHYPYRIIACRDCPCNYVLSVAAPFGACQELVFWILLANLCFWVEREWHVHRYNDIKIYQDVYRY